jgi:thiol:disulfide interchange protein
MVDLYADWCGPCKLLDRLTFSNADVQAALSKDFVAVKVNIETSKENRDLAIQLNTAAIPHIVFFDSNGKKLSEIVGFVPADQFRDELRKATETAAKK